MIPPKIKPPVVWQPGMLVWGAAAIKPVHANEYFVVNSARQTIMRALVSSRAACKKQPK